MQSSEKSLHFRKASSLILKITENSCMTAEVPTFTSADVSTTKGRCGPKAEELRSSCLISIFSYGKTTWNICFVFFCPGLQGEARPGTRTEDQATYDGHAGATSQPAAGPHPRGSDASSTQGTGDGEFVHRG